MGARQKRVADYFFLLLNSSQLSRKQIFIQLCRVYDGKSMKFNAGQKSSWENFPKSTIAHFVWVRVCVRVCGCVSLLGQQSHHTLAAMWPPTTRTPPARDKKKYKNDSDPCDVGLWGSRKQQQKKGCAFLCVKDTRIACITQTNTHTQTHNPSEYWVRMGKVLSTLLHSLERARERFSPAWQSSKTVSPHPLTVLPRKDCAFFRCTVISRSQQQQDGALHRARKTISTLTRTCTHTHRGRAKLTKWEKYENWTNSRTSCTSSCSF